MSVSKIGKIKGDDAHKAFLLFALSMAFLGQNVAGQQEPWYKRYKNELIAGLTLSIASGIYIYTMGSFSAVQNSNSVADNVLPLSFPQNIQYMVDSSLQESIQGVRILIPFIEVNGKRFLQDSKNDNCYIWNQIEYRWSAANSLSNRSIHYFRRQNPK